MEYLRIVFGITFLFFSLQGQAQGKFYKNYTDLGYDFGEGVVQLADSSYLVTGASSSFGEGPAQAFIMHVDKFGNRIWSKSYGGAESDRGRRIFQIPNDGIYVAGYTNSGGNGSFDFYFFKTDLSGNLIYEKTYGGSNFEKLHDATFVSKDSSFILVGETKSNAAEVENLYIMRLTSQGDTLWTKQIGSAGVDIARAVTMISDTTFVVVGDYYVADSLKQKGLYMKMHINGTVDWLSTIGQRGAHSLNDLSFDEGRVRAVGYVRYSQNNINYSRLYGFVGDLDGTTYNEAIDNSPAINSRYGYLTSYGNQPNQFYVSEQALISSATQFIGGGEDAIISKVEGYGLYWIAPGVNMSNIGDDQITQLIRTSDGGAIAVGYNSYAISGGNNVTLLKIGKNDDFLPSYTLPDIGSLVFINELETSIQAKIYPNPVNEVLQIEVESMENINVKVMNAYGSLVENTSFNKLTSIDLSHYPAGLYLVQLEISGTYKTFKILKK
jgi:hypothetical protein